MRVNNVNIGALNHKAQAFPSFGVKKIYDWANDPDFQTPKQAFDDFIKTMDGRSAFEKTFDEDVLDIFEGRDKRNESPAVCTFTVSEGRGKTTSNKLITRGTAAIMTFYVLLTGLMPGGLADLYARGCRQKELEDSFKDNPRAVAEEFIESLGFDDKSLRIHRDILGADRFEGSITGNDIDFIEKSGLPMGKDSSLDYQAGPFFTGPGTTYQAALDIDGDKNPEIIATATADGIVEKFRRDN